MKTLVRPYPTYEQDLLFKASMLKEGCEEAQLTKQQRDKMLQLLTAALAAITRK